MTEAVTGAVVLIHGAWHDGWCWQLVGRRLTEKGVAWIAPDLGLRSFAEDVAVIQAIIDDPVQGFVVVGHSRGGVVASFATAGRTNVKHLVYVAAPMVGEGQIRLPNRRETMRSRAVHRADGTYFVDPALAREFLYGDCEPALAAEAIARLRPTAEQDENDVREFMVGWRTIPSTYVVCRADRCIDPRDQRAMAMQAGDVVELASSHSPQLSHPGVLADLIAERARRAGVAASA